MDDERQKAIAKALMGTSIVPSARPRSNPMNLPIPGTSFNPINAPDAWNAPGQLLPLQRNRISGEIRFAAPQALTSVIDALNAPQRALRGQYNQVEVNPETGYVSQFDPRMIQDAATLSSLYQGGSMAAPRPKGSLGSGGHIYRETNGEGLLDIMTGNLRDPYNGQARLYWADTPELARGQFNNIGIRVKMRNEGVDLREHNAKPGLQYLKNAGDTGREFISNGGVDFSKVDEFVLTKPLGRSPFERALENRLEWITQDGSFKREVTKSGVKYTRQK